MAGFDPDAYLAQKLSAPPAFDPDAYLASKTNGMPGPRKEPVGFLTKLGRSAASLGDITVGGVIPAITQQVAYPVARAFGQTPEEATATTGKIVGAVDQPFGKAFGVTQTPEYQSEASRKIMDFVGANIQKGSKWISQQTGIPEADVTNMIGTMTLAAPEAVRAAAPVVPAIKKATGTAVEAARATPVGQAIEAPIKARRAATEAKNVAASYANATKIEAAQSANKLGIALNPAESNPTTGNKMRSVVTGNKDINASLAAVNEGKWTDIVKQDLGVSAEGRLNTAAIEQALDVASKPYDTIRAIPKMEPSGGVVASIRELNKPATIGGRAKSDAVSSLVGETLDALKEGRSGAQVLDDIRQLRRDAQSTYKARDKGNNPPPADVAAADAKMAIAGALERMIDEHAPTPQVLSDFQAARQRMAQIYDHERAIDYSTNKVDPQVYAKLLDERKGNMSGVGADIGKVAANFPEVSKVGGTATPTWQQGLTRSGVAGTLGYAAGTLVGAPIAGAVTGAVVGKLASGINAKRIASPAYQAAHAVPVDYRPVNMLRPVEPGVPKNAMVPYDFSQQVLTPDQIPNWTYGRSDIPPRVTPTGVPPGPAQIPMSQGPVGGQMGALRAEDARLYQAQAAAEAQAQAAAEAQAAATRQPARGGVQFDLDPVTGELVPVSATLRGATPNVQVLESTGKSLQSASEKMASGKSPALFSAEERIAWNKTKVDLAEVDPGLSKLSDKAIANKMMDRQWVDETINKARQQARMFDEIAQRSRDKQAVAMAEMKREKMLDLLNDLEEKLRPGRAVSSGAQGPKTRAFNRNKLAPLTENQNSLAP